MPSREIVKKPRGGQSAWDYVLYGDPLSSQEIFKKWAGAVVTVETPTKTGTGFFNEFGFLYTAYHVLEGVSSATITFSSGQKARITGAIVADKAKDYALLMTDTRVVGPKLGDYAAVQPGERVTVIASPRGLAQTVTEGIVSAKRQDGSRRLLQLSAGISPGSSGSPVFNSRGEVVGLVVETLDGGQTLNFAVSSADLKGRSGVPLRQAFPGPRLPLRQPHRRPRRPVAPDPSCVTIAIPCRSTLLSMTRSATSD